MAQKVPDTVWIAVIAGIVAGTVAWSMGYESGLAKCGQGLLAPLPPQ